MTKLQEQDKAFDVWRFPPMESSYTTIEINYDEKNKMKTQEDEIKKEQIALQERTQYLDNIGLDIKRMLAEIDAQLLTNITTIIRKSVKKIILKELDLDEEALKKMILSALETLNKDNEALQVYISAADQLVFTETDRLNHVEVKVDPTLARGDFIIKTKFSEIVAVLEQHLNTLFGI